jgi:hypothetical protein
MAASRADLTVEFDRHVIATGDSSVFGVGVDSVVRTAFRNESCYTRPLPLCSNPWVRKTNGKRAMGQTTNSSRRTTVTPTQDVADFVED